MIYSLVMFSLHIIAICTVVSHDVCIDTLKSVLPTDPLLIKIRNRLIIISSSKQYSLRGRDWGHFQLHVSCEKLQCRWLKHFLCKADSESSPARCTEESHPKPSGGFTFTIFGYNGQDGGATWAIIRPLVKSDLALVATSFLSRAV